MSPAEPTAQDIAERARFLALNSPVFAAQLHSARRVLDDLEMEVPFDTPMVIAVAMVVQAMDPVTGELPSMSTPVPTLRPGGGGVLPLLPPRADCRCLCHTPTGAMHIAPCCDGGYL